MPIPLASATTLNLYLLLFLPSSATTAAYLAGGIRRGGGGGAQDATGEMAEHVNTARLTALHAPVPRNCYVLTPARTATAYRLLAWQPLPATMALVAVRWH